MFLSIDCGGEQDGATSGMVSWLRWLSGETSAVKASENSETCSEISIQTKSNEYQEQYGLDIPQNAQAMQIKMQEQRRKIIERLRSPAGDFGSRLVSENEAEFPPGSGRLPEAYFHGTSIEDDVFQPASCEQRFVIQAVQPQSICDHWPDPDPSGFDSVVTNPSSTAHRAPSRDEWDMSGLVVPESDDGLDEERRRMNLAQELDERGLLQEYDPTIDVCRLTSEGKKAPFDIANIGEKSMKQFLLQPAPKDAGMVECRIIRERAGFNRMYPSYILQSESGIFLMSAKKKPQNRTSNYTLAMSKDKLVNKHSEFYLGKLRSNFLGLKFVTYGSGLNPKKIDGSMPQCHAIQLARQELVSVQYTSSLWGSKPRGPRKMCVVIPRVSPSCERVVCRTLVPEKEGLLAALRSNSQTSQERSEVFRNKPPRWNETIGAFVLNFNKRVTQASVKNFQLTSSSDPDTVYLQFGRVGKDEFNMDFRHPFSPMQAFAICLSAFDYKLCCE